MFYKKGKTKKTKMADVSFIKYLCFRNTIYFFHSLVFIAVLYEWNVSFAF